MGNTYASVSGKGNDNWGKERRCKEYIYTERMNHVTVCTDIITLRYCLRSLPKPPLREAFNMFRSHHFPSMPAYFSAQCRAHSSALVKPVVVVGPHLCTQSSRNWSQSIHFFTCILCHQWNLMILCIDCGVFAWFPSTTTANEGAPTVENFITPDLTPFGTDRLIFWVIGTLLTSKQCSRFFMYIYLHVDISSLTCLLCDLLPMTMIWPHGNVLAWRWRLAPGCTPAERGPHSFAGRAGIMNNM